MTALHKFEFVPSKKIVKKDANLFMSQLENQFAKLKSYLLKIEGIEKQSFEEHEQAIQKIIHDLGCDALGLCLSNYDSSSEIISMENQTYRKIMRSSKIYQTCMGEVTVERNLYSNRKKDGDGKSICPLELQAGIIEGHWTPTAAKNALYALAHLTPNETETLLLQFGSMAPSRSNLDRLPKLINNHWEPVTILQHEKIIQEENVPHGGVCVAASLDGVMVAMKPEKTTKKADKNRQCEWKEASCGTISFFDKEGERLSTLQYGRMPENKKMTLKKLLQINIETILSKHPKLQLVHLADGARDNWTFFDEEMPLGFQVVDFYHACEYLKSATATAYKDNTGKAREQFDKYKKILRDELNGVETVIRALRYLKDAHKGNADIESSLTYFINNRHRMNYAKAKELKYPIGSGIVEASCKTLVSTRLKRSGMSWCQHGGQGILTFRALIKSGRFDKAWDFVAKQYKKAVTVHKNVIAFPGECLV